MNPAAPLDLDWLRRRMPGREILHLSTTPSTMLDAARLAASGAPSGTVATAEEQTAGKGRAGHSWHSEPYAGLYLTLILRPNLPGDSLPLLTLATGLAVKEAVESIVGVQADLKWPNDLLIEGRKAAGILLTFEASAVLAGIGINVNHTRFPDPLAPLATSLRLAGRRELTREPLLVRTVEAVERHAALLASHGAPAIIDAFSHASSFVFNRPVSVDLDGRTLTGHTAGLDPRGFLRLRTSSGELVTILAGGVRAL